MELEPDIKSSLPKLASHTYDVMWSLLSNRKTTSLKAQETMNEWDETEINWLFILKLYYLPEQLPFSPFLHLIKIILSPNINGISPMTIIQVSWQHTPRPPVYICTTWNCSLKGSPNNMERTGHTIGPWAFIMKQYF